ncbi:hypothetical protein O181_092342 [Austropuccinia psidii MF-1]|uniref:Uncharacterized protein n=1 Tax=Austropuccinia psidii MF-1 TaxID=1389203 RepID=A0A9Q3IYY6_9BASI|nr:hypothetical protein [Austropuccinia psidii MF-1]
MTSLQRTLRLFLVFYLSVFSHAEKTKKFVEETKNSTTAGIFPFRDYKEFQISDGTAGDSKERAAKVFVEPFNGVDLSRVDQTDLQNLQNMSKAAILNEEFFVKAISVQLAQKVKGLNVEARIKEAEEKLAKNIALDKKTKGRKMISYLSLDGKQGGTES